MIELEQTFRPKEAVKTTGIQSQVIIGEFAGISSIKKLSGTELNVNEREEMVWAMLAYRQQLSTNGIAIPQNFMIQNTPEGVETIDEMVNGEDLDILIKQGMGRNEWNRVVNSLCDLNSGQNQSRILIDAKPANWIVNSKTYFIDFFPPTLRGEDGKLYPWIYRIYKRSRDLFTFNYGDTRGQITKLLAGARMTYPGIYPSLAKATIEISEARLPGKIAEYIREQVESGFSDMGLFYSNSIAGEEKLKHLLI